MGLSSVVVVLEGLSLWLSAPLVNTLFLPDATAPERPAFEISNAYGLLKYYTYSYLQQYDPLTALKMVCLFMALAFLAKNAVMYIKNLVLARVSLHVERDLRNAIYSHAMRLPVSYYDRNRSGDIISLVVRDVSMIESSMTNTLDKLILEPMRIMFFIAMLFAISLRLSLAVLVVLPILATVIAVVGAAVRRRSTRMLKTFSGLMSILHETVGGIRAVKLFGMEHVEAERFEAETQRFVDRSFRSAMAGRLTGPFTEVLGVSVAVVMLWFGGRATLVGQGISAEDLVLFLIYVFSCLKPIKTLSGVHNALQAGFAAAERVLSVLDLTKEGVSAASGTRPVLHEKIEFSHVDFVYPGTEKKVLSDITFTVPKGSVVALVGPSGSGKSTILDLLPRFYDPTSGNIRIDGTDVRDIDLSHVRSYFGAVAQETILFNDTVYNNIAYGATGATRERIIECAKAANAWAFIEQMPQGLTTLIGERGIMLSGGQRQRLAIARALLRNPPVLILDEATSALDTESERLVQNAINTLMANRTVLVVAHRLSTIRHADEILVLEQGRIIERGTHENLMKSDGRYRSIHELQFASGTSLA